MSLVRRSALAAGLAVAAVAVPRLHAQITTTASLAGRVTAGGEAVASAQVVAVHRPSGTTYRATTRTDGRFVIPGMRVGGPYQVTVRALGYAPESRDNIALELGNRADLSVALTRVAAQLSAVTVEGSAAGPLTAARTGAATDIPRAALATLPTISRSINDFTRLTPQASPNGASFAGQDTRFNNTTIDGAAFNNAFGLGTGQPGGRTGVAPIPLDAIDQVQVNVAPYDVRQGGFVGAGVNAVTRSGTNNYEGSLYYFARNQRYVGREAFGARVNPGTFNYDQIGARLGGPVLHDRLFFFADYENDKLTLPGTTYLPNSGSQPVGGNVTRVSQSDVTQLSSFLAQNFNYQTGPYTGYTNATPSTRFLARADYNVNDYNKLNVRYVVLNSSADQLASNSNSLGFGNRRTNPNALSYANSGYSILENIRSLVGELNSQIAGGRLSNNVLAGYTSNDESRGSKGTLFPTVDILQQGSTYLNFGFEPFTPDNQLRYNTLQVSDNLTATTGAHEFTVGAQIQRYRSENVFFPGSQSVYVYNSLADFYADANDFLANPARTTSPVTLRRFQVRYNNIPGQTEPLQPLHVVTTGAYAQDVWRATPRFDLTAGVRVDVPTFGATAFTNPQANALTFRDAAGNPAHYETQQLPGANALVSPRVGFNWDVRGDRSTQIRGGTGIFSGSPAYVWISNQIGQNGIQTGFTQADNTTAYPFNPNPNAYKPTTVTGAPAASYEVDYTTPGFKFPQQWRSTLAIDQRLPAGFVATVEGILGRDVNGVSYINANLPAAQSAFTGADTRPRWVATTPGANPTRINQNITGAFVLGNQNVGHNYDLAGSLEKNFGNGLYVKLGANYAVSKNLIDPGSIASGTYSGNAIVTDPNNPRVGYSAYSPGHREFGAVSYRREYFHFGATTLSLFGENATQISPVTGQANASYVFAGDMNGDGQVGNDLIFIQRDTSQMNFVPIKDAKGNVLYTRQQQQGAWQTFIQQDRYLRAHEGQYAERNAVFLPALFRLDASLAQEVFRTAAGKRNAVQIRLDVFNFANMLNHNWGVGQQFVTTQPLVAAGADANGAAQYQLATVGGQLISRTFQRTATTADVYRVQLSLRYTFQ
ncbi:MAG TPA: carboxypeptidase regulatory-like domain-containing protein [Gemmatirosa sp.]